MHGTVAATESLQASPEFKGIKTEGGVTDTAIFELQASPEFKGIKTAIF